MPEIDGFKLQRDSFGRLIFTDHNGVLHEGVVLVRAFPIAAPDQGIALVSAEGHELLWIERLGALPEAIQTLLSDELANREFMPKIKRITKVSTFATPSTWSVETDRGNAQFVLKGEEDIRRIGMCTLLIADTHGIQFLIQDLSVLDRGSRKILDRFL